MGKTCPKRQTQVSQESRGEYGMCVLGHPGGRPERVIAVRRGARGQGGRSRYPTEKQRWVKAGWGLSRGRDLGRRQALHGIAETRENVRGLKFDELQLLGGEALAPASDLAVADEAAARLDGLQRAAGNAGVVLLTVEPVFFLAHLLHRVIGDSPLYDLARAAHLEEVEQLQKDIHAVLPEFLVLQEQQIAAGSQRRVQPGFDMVLPGTMALAAEQHLVEIKIESRTSDPEIFLEGKLGERDVADIANQVDRPVVSGVVGFMGPDEAALIGQEAGAVAAVGQPTKRAIDAVKAGRLPRQDFVEHKSQPRAAGARVAGKKNVGLAQAAVTPMHDGDPGGRRSNPVTENTEKKTGPGNFRNGQRIGWSRHSMECHSSRTKVA